MSEANAEHTAAGQRADFSFEVDERLGIRVPVLTGDWAAYTVDAQSAMIAEWEGIRARIPDRVKQLEALIDACQQEIAGEEEWDRVCELYAEVYRIASIINDLNIWQTIEPQTSASIKRTAPSMAAEHFHREK